MREESNMWNMLDLKYLVFGARDIDNHLMIKQQGNIYTIIRRHRWGDKCQVHTLWDNLRLITSEGNSHFCD